MINFKIPVLDDILKGMPDNARLRAEVTELHSQLKIALEENKKLQAQVDKSNVQDDLLEEEIEILKILFNDGSGLRTIDLSVQLRKEIGKIEYHIDSLIKRNFVDFNTYMSGYRIPVITEPGRAYLVEGGIV
jgi:hypothetical protein